MENPLKASFDSSETFREIFQSMSEGIIIVDENGKILLTNPVAEAMFGYDKNELIGMPLEELLPERYRKHHIGYRKGYVTTPQPRRMGLGRDLTAQRKNGEEFPVEISLSFTKVNKSSLVMAFISDISQRKKAEDALRQSEEQLIVYAAELERKVQARTDELKQSVKELENEVLERKKAEEEARRSLERERELNELKSKFVSIASHEFRTPLSAILSSTSLVEQYKKKGDLDKIDKHVLRIRSSVNHLTGILNDFLSLGKLEEGRVDVISEPVPVEELLNEINEEMRVTLKQGQEIFFQYTASVQSIQSDPRILRNILFNLLSNAIKYSDINKKIHLICQNTDSQLLISVKDEGMGIPLEEQKHLFERFFRATNASNIQGTGLGLNIVKRYVDLLNGSITFSSEYGKGSVFIISVPLVP